MTICPAATALYYSVAKSVRRGRGGPYREYFRSFRENFRQGAALSVILALFCAVGFFAAVYVVNLPQSAAVDFFYRATFFFALIVAFLILAVACPVLSRFRFKTAQILLFSLRAALRFPLRTLGLAALWGCAGRSLPLLPARAHPGPRAGHIRRDLPARTRLPALHAGAQRVRRGYGHLVSGMIDMKAKRLICLLLAASCLCVCCSASASSEDAGFCGVPFLDSRTVLVGDSLTCHLVDYFLKPMDLLCGASYMAAPNSAVNYYFEDWWPLKPLEQNAYGSTTSPGLEGLTFAEAVEATAGRFERVLFLMGSNSSEYSVVEDYTVVIDHMLENWPEATIYVQTVPDSVTGVVATERINGVIADTVACYEALGETRVVLLDSHSCWGSGCYLPDGAHLTDIGIRRWYDFLAQNLLARGYLMDDLAAKSLPELRRARAEQQALRLAERSFVISPLER